MDTSGKAGDDAVKRRKKDNKTTVWAVVTSILVIFVLGALMVKGLGPVVIQCSTNRRILLLKITQIKISMR